MPRWFKFDALPPSPPNPNSRPIPDGHEPTDEELLATDNLYHLIGMQDPALHGEDGNMADQAPGSGSTRIDSEHSNSAFHIEPLGSYDPILNPNPTFLENPIAGGHLRVSDPMGQGHFGAPRKGKPQGHEGIDIVAPPGTLVASSVDGVVLKINPAYKKNVHTDEPTYWIVDVMTTNGDIVRHMYVAPAVKEGDFVNAGESIGRVQDLSRRHGKSMTNHLHLALRPSTWRPIDRSYLDPTPRMRWEKIPDPP